MMGWTDAEKEALLADAGRILGRGDRGWYEIREQEHTDVDKRLAEAKALCAETQRILERDRRVRRGQASNPPARWEPTPHLIASIKGPFLGWKWNRDPFACARGLGLRVEYAPPERLGGVNGLYWGLLGSPLIQLSDSLSGAELYRVCAHELGHHVLGVAATEGDCDNFARYFLNATLPETPRERWHRWQNEKVERLREQARWRAAARAF